MAVILRAAAGSTPATASPAALVGNLQDDRHGKDVS
jgi:hypothetical protein